MEIKLMNKRVLISVIHLGKGGGGEKMAAELGSLLKEKNHDVTILTFYKKKDIYEYSGKTICLNEKLNLNPINQMMKVIKRAKKISKICKKNEIDTVISIMNIANLSVILSKFLFLNKSKIIITEHNNTLEKSFLNRFFIKTLFPKADLVVAVSKGIEHILKKDFKLKKTKTIYNAMNTMKFNKKNKISTKHINYFDGFVFINVGRLVEQKAHWNLVRAFKKVSDECEEAKLIIRGSGPLEQKIKELIDKLELNNKVFLLEKVDDIYPYYEKADCFVLSSNYEGFGIVIIEALSKNLPTISTDCISGPREILCPELEINQKIKYPYYGRYGILVEPMLSETNFNDLKEKPLTPREEKLADVMIDFAKDDKLRKKYNNGLKRAKDFDKNKIIGQWEKIL
jgi:glycosyltransferase involved in cell wall biosynthesis